MRKLVLFACTYAIISFATSARAQVDIAVGGGTLFSAKSSSASLAFPPPPERGGLYPSASFQLMLKEHLGVNVEGAFRYRQAFYNGYQAYRPILYDVNAVYSKPVSDRMRLDLMAGGGGQSVLFYNQYGTCSPAYSGNCRISTNSNHFLVHVGGDLRYYFWRNFFARPEAHYYYILNNTEFHSKNVLRLGASIGYTFGSK